MSRAVALGASRVSIELKQFFRDRESAPGRLVFNRTVGLKDTWAKVSGAKAPPPQPTSPKRR